MFVRARRTTQMMSIAFRNPRAAPTRYLSIIKCWRSETRDVYIKIENNKKIHHVSALPVKKKKKNWIRRLLFWQIDLFYAFYVLNVNRHDVLRITKFFYG